MTNDEMRIGDRDSVNGDRSLAATRRYSAAERDAAEIPQGDDGSQGGAESASETPPTNRRRDVPHGNGDPSRRMQLTLFEVAEHPLLDEIRALDLDATSPREALARLVEWQEQLALHLDGLETVGVENETRGGLSRKR